MAQFEQDVREQWPEKADTILGLIRGTIDPDTFESVTHWVGQCYNAPSSHDRIACALNEVLGGFGVEAILDEGVYIVAVLEYINFGDPYATTLLCERGKWSVGSWGDWVEVHEGEGR